MEFSKLALQMTDGIEEILTGEDLQKYKVNRKKPEDAVIKQEAWVRLAEKLQEGFDKVKAEL